MAKTLVVIGGGAAGFFCAVNAIELNPALKVIVLEKQGKVLQKVKVSGGGRCNVTHACFRLSELLQNYPRGKAFLKKAMSSFAPQDTIAWFEDRGVPLKTEEDGRVFPLSNQSQSIIDCLLKSAVNIQLQLHSEVIELTKPEKNSFLLRLKNEQTIRADYVFLAPGGFPKIEQYAWLQQTGHRFIPPVPSLFTFNTPHSTLRDLMGVSVEHALVKIQGTSLSNEGPLLITHWGLSGPAILKLSAWGARELYDKNYRFKVLINWSGIPEHQLREQWNMKRNKLGSSTIGTKNPIGLPKRLWDYLICCSEISPETRWSELPAKEQNKLIHLITTFELDVEGKTTFKEEFVTCGGIDLADIDAHTMQSKLIEGLYFGGELMDVDGVTGGFNFQHAWTSGMLAARSIASQSI